MNSLAAYFAETGESPSSLAERIGRAPSTLTRTLNGERRPSFDVALDVERGTDGRVKAAEFMTICLEAWKGKRAVLAQPQPAAGEAA